MAGSDKVIGEIFWSEDCQCAVCKAGINMLKWSGLKRSEVEEHITDFTEDQLNLLNGPNGYTLYKALMARKNG